MGSETAKNNKSGVTRYNKEKAFLGYNLFTGGGGNIYLTDMSGKIVHRWNAGIKIRGKTSVDFIDAGRGTIAACRWGGHYTKGLDSNSRAEKSFYIYPWKTHHDIAVLPDGSYVVPVSYHAMLYNFRLVSFSFLLFLSPAGEVLETWSAFEHLDELNKFCLPSPLDTEPDITLAEKLFRRGYFLAKRLYFHMNEKYSRRRFAAGVSDTREQGSGQGDAAENRPPLLERINHYMLNRMGQDESYDYSHLNSVEVLPETILGNSDKRFRKGNYLICLRNLDLVLILDGDSKKPVWGWGPGVLDWPHAPVMLENGNILVFDNGAHRGYSRVLEVNPGNDEIVWEYKSDPPEDFYSKLGSSAQRLPNGNTLICEEGKGRAFEITGQGEIVWEFYNPVLIKGRRRMIYRMKRYPKERIEKWLHISR